MLEETNKKTKELAQEIAGSLDVGALHVTLRNFRALMQDKRAKNTHYAERAMFRTYHCLVYLTHYGMPAETVGEWVCTHAHAHKHTHTCTHTHIHKHTHTHTHTEPKKEEGELYKAWEHCKRWSRSVEVFYKNMDGDKVLTKVHFPYNPDVSV